MECPICKGKGELPLPKYNRKEVEVKRDMAKILIEKGFSVRQVQKFLGYKSTNSITQLLK